MSIVESALIVAEPRVSQFPESRVAVWNLFSQLPGAYIKILRVLVKAYDYSTRLCRYYPQQTRKEWHRSASAHCRRFRPRAGTHGQGIASRLARGASASFLSGRPVTSRRSTSPTIIVASRDPRRLIRPAGAYGRPPLCLE